MRLFEFYCSNCKKNFEEFVKIDESKKKKKTKTFGVKCPFCKSKNIERVYSSFSTVGGEPGKPKGSGQCSVCSPSCKATSCP